MPYIVTFTKPLGASGQEQYINDCCIGGDIVLDHLLPSLRATYGDLQSNQEDWGWFAWFARNGIKLAVDVHTHDASLGEFQIHLTSRKNRFLLGSKIQDTPELEELRKLVMSSLENWEVSGLEVELVNDKYR